MVNPRGPRAQRNADAVDAADATEPAKNRGSNQWVRTTQLDEETCNAVAAWQVKHGVRSQSAALRLLLQSALTSDGALDVVKQVAVARSGALRAAKAAASDAIDQLAKD